MRVGTEVGPFNLRSAIRSGLHSAELSPGRSPESAISEDTSTRIARAVLGPQAIIGVTVYGKPGEESAAAEAGADYVAVGSFFPSPTKPEEPVSPMHILDAVVHRSPLPVFAIGGVTAKNAGLLARHRVAGVAVVSAIMEAPDPRRAAEAIRRAFFGASGP